MASRAGGHTLEEVMNFLLHLKRMGTHGTTEIIFRDHDIVVMKHCVTYHPGELPKLSDSSRSVPV